MGFESPSCAARRLRRYTDATRDTALRAELLALLETPASPTTIPATPTATSFSDTAPMHTPPLADRVSSYVPWTIERTESELAIPASPADVALAPRLPVEHLERALGCGDVMRELMACLATQARAIALVREAHALGAISMPPEVAAALAAATSAIPAVMRGGSLPIA
jgi:hypothetical protein